MLILAADVGGTNSRFIAYAIDASHGHVTSARGHQAPGKLVKSHKYMNQDFYSFEEIMRTFLASLGADQGKPVVACVAVAGPVANNKAELTNRATWPAIDGKALATAFGIAEVEIINDFVAMGYGLLTLDEEKECRVLQRGTGKVAGAPIACVGAGTGLGECYLTADMGGDYSCHASEGGHAEFSPRNLEQVHLQSHLKQKFQEAHRVSVERVVSGPGILSVYEYFVKTLAREVDPAFSKQLETAGDLKPALIAQNEDCALCRRTMALFMSQYGAEAGVACCKWIPRGGLYLTGGITSKNMAQVSDPDGLFMKSLVDKGRLSGLVQSIPVYAVLVEDLGERGAHWQAFRLYQRHMGPPAATAATAATIATATSAAAAATAVSAASSDPDTFVLTLSIAAAAAVAGFVLGRAVRP